MQLHLSSILINIGDAMCIKSTDRFNIEMESNYKGKNIDITCSLANERAAIELKCFRKSSNRAVDTDMYDVLKDLERLASYSQDFNQREFYCLTDDPYYFQGAHKGHAGTVSIKEGSIYKKDKPIKPGWVGRWKDSSRDKEIILPKDVTMSWKSEKSWSYLNIEM